MFFFVAFLYYNIGFNKIWFFQKKKMKNKDLKNNLSQTISKELKKPNEGNKKLIDTLQKILDKLS